MDIGTIAGSAVIAALVAGVVSLRNSDRAIRIDNITKERTKWRDKIRCLAAQIHETASDFGPERSARLDKLLLDLKLNLNPEDPRDVEIRDRVRRLIACSPDAVGPLLTELGDRLALLLKHDWERAKNEASAVPGKECWCPAKRTSFDKYEFKDQQ